MANKEKAFGMTYEEFCDFFEQNGGFGTPPNRNHQYIRKGESLLAFVNDGCTDLINEDADILGALK